MFERRLRLFLLCIFLGAFLLAARATQVQVIQRNDWITRANDDAERPTYIPARRGDLLDFNGKVIATDVPAFEASVNFRVIEAEKDSKWFGEEAARRARKMPGWSAADQDQRLLMVAQQQQTLHNEVGDLWTAIETIGNKSADDIKAIREEIVQDVKDKHDASAKHQFAAATQAFADAPKAHWWQRMIAGAPREPLYDTFDQKVFGDEVDFHTILPDLTQQQYNQLALLQDRFPQYRLDTGAMVSMLKLGPAVRRQYPYGDVACQIIGRVGPVDQQDRLEDPNKDDDHRRYLLNDRIGRDGLEGMAEEQLRGTRGTKYADRRGTALRADEADSGQDVKSTIDIDLQRDIQNAFKAVDFVGADNPKDVHNKSIPDIGPMNGAAVVIDVKTGQVRALVSVPTFDLNHFDDLYSKLVDDDLNRPMVNRALMDAIEPGSTVKPIIGLGVVTEGKATVEDTIECTGYPIINGHRVDKPRCWTMSLFKMSHHQVPYSDPHPTGFLNLTDAIERSCNVYFETQGNKLTLQGESYWMRQFGFGRRTGIGLSEARGLTPDKAHIPVEEKGSAPLYSAIGQSWVLATPMQVANEMATIARGGIWQRPTLLMNPPPRPSIEQSDEDAIPDRYDLHLSPLAMEAVHEGMKRVVASEAGTAIAIRRPDVEIAAKSGSATANPLARILRDPDTGLPLRDDKGRPKVEYMPYGSHAQRNPELPWYRMTGFDDNGKPKGTHSWVAGYAPAENPTIAFAVYVEYGGSGGSGAASVVKQMFDALIKDRYVPTKTVMTPVAVPAADGPIDIDH